MQFAITLALLPPTLLFFQQFSLMSLIANFIAMSVVCLVVIPLSLFGTLGLLVAESMGKVLLLLGAKIFSGVWMWLSFLASFDSSWYHAIYNLAILLVSILGSVLLLAPRGFPAKYLGVFWFMPLFFYSPPLPRCDGEVWLTLLDVGQGLAALVQTKRHNLIYDTGPKFFDDDAGARIMVPYLRQTGIARIDIMVVSHGDSDHSGGVSSILKEIPATRIITSSPAAILPHTSEYCVTGQRWQWDGVDFTILSPPEKSDLEGNNASCVLKITLADGQAILLTGDIERRAENLLVNTQKGMLDSTVLVAPHHGSGSSSTAQFIAAVRPQYVLFPVGYRNRFRFPNKKVVAKYAAMGAELLDISKLGAITFKLRNKSAILSINKYRDVIRRFWHDD